LRLAHLSVHGRHEANDSAAKNILEHFVLSIILMLFCFLSLSLSLFVFSSDITISLIFWPISLLEQQPCPGRSRVNIFSILDVALADHFKVS
jgi:hypothetical protein